MKEAGICALDVHRYCLLKAVDLIVVAAEQDLC